MWKEVLVPIGVIAVLGSLLLPLPTMVIDFLLVVNLIGALVLITSALYVPNPTKLSTLPALLLLATLFRLALNISTTRLILGTGEAGFMIQTFGDMLMQGNIVVGAVVFLVLTLVQLIVIAKGAERVAEVSARFTLDALPGKQMSIDADVRAGLLSIDDAKERRKELQIESRFYGALDGAMKFVKGDAIAGIVITVINVIGGFAVGSFLLGLDMTVALNKYTLLTVGDGLLSQIPALLNSIAAGIVVTRVVRDEKQSLVNELPQQLGESKKARVLVGIVGLLLAAIPGTPILPFLFVSILLLGSVVLSNKQASDAESAQESERFDPKTPPLLELAFGQETLTLFTDRQKVENYFHELIQSVFESTGLILAVPSVKVDKERGREVQLIFRGIPTSECAVGDSWEAFEQEFREYFLAFIEQHKVEVIDDIATRRMIDAFDSQAPELVSHVIPNVTTVTQLTALLRELLREDISLRNMDVILQTISEYGERIDDNRLLLEEIRIALGRMITAPRVENGQIHGLRVDPIIDMSFAQSEKTKESLSIEFMEHVRRSFEVAQESSSAPVYFVSRQARKLLFEFLQAYRMPATVLAFEELPRGVEIAESGVVVLPEEETQQVIAGFDA